VYLSGSFWNIRINIINNPYFNFGHFTGMREFEGIRLFFIPNLKRGVINWEKNKKRKKF